MGAERQQIYSVHKHFFIKQFKKPGTRLMAGCGRVPGFKTGHHFMSTANLPDIILYNNLLLQGCITPNETVVYCIDLFKIW